MKRTQRIPHYVWGLLIGILIASVYLKVRQGMLDGRRPELTKMDDQKTRAGQPWSLSVELSSGAVWDDTDESKIVLYRVAPEGFITLRELDRSEFTHGKVMMPSLESGERYQMLTQFFFCDKQKSHEEKCRIQGFAMDLYPDNAAEPLTVNFTVGRR